jgi:hypothetical protein
MRRAKSGTLKSGKGRHPKVKSRKQRHRHRPVRGAQEGGEGPPQEELDADHSKEVVALNGGLGMTPGQPMKSSTRVAAARRAGRARPAPTRIRISGGVRRGGAAGPAAGSGERAGDEAGRRRGGQPGFGGFGGSRRAPTGAPRRELQTTPPSWSTWSPTRTTSTPSPPTSCPTWPRPSPILGLLGLLRSGRHRELDGVDRHGTAYVNYASGKIFTVDTRTLACTDTGFVPGQAGFSPNLSMGFSADAPGSSAETLFVSDNTGDDTPDPDGKGLARWI